MSSKMNEWLKQNALRMSRTDDESTLVENDQLSHSIQPHLTFERDADDVTGPEYVNPALDDSTTVSNRNGTVGQHSAHDQRVSTNGHSTTTTTTATTIPPGQVKDPNTRPVHYSNQAGERVVIQEPVVVIGTDGRSVIQTQQCCHLAPHRHRERPLRIRHIKLLKVFSILAIVIFFPLGIPALYYAFKAHKEFDAGIMRGDLDLARKLAKRSERMIIFSILAALLVAVIVFAVVERELMSEDEYWRTRGAPVMATG